MPEAHAVLNELSFSGAPRGEVDTELMQALGKALLALRRAVAVHDQPRVVFKTPPGLGALKLPGGTPFSKALSSLPDDLRVVVHSLLDGPWFDDSIAATWHFADAPALGLGEALALKGLAVSLDRPAWRAPEIPVQRKSRRGAHAKVPNVWQATLADSHRAVLAQHVPVLPAYEDPGTHDPDSPKYDHQKSHLPRNAAHVLRHAVSADGSHGTWWAKCEHGFFHRFDGALKGARWVVHWNGTTNPNARRVTREEDVPGDLRKRLEGLKPVEDCGCRELEP